VTGSSSKLNCRIRFAHTAENRDETIDARGAGSGRGVQMAEVLSFAFGSAQPTDCGDAKQEYEVHE